MYVPGMECAQQLCLVTSDSENGALSESEDWRSAGYLMKLVDPLLASLTLVSRVRVSVNVVRVDVEGDQGQGGEGGRVDYGHVIGGVDAHRGNIGASTGPDVWDTPGQHLSGVQCYHLIIIS